MSEQKTHDMFVTRTFEAPLERVWRSWSDPDQVMTWWGPQGSTAPMCRMDFREGGTTLVSMRSAEGWEVFNTWSYPFHRADGTDRVRSGVRGQGR